jgi:hypothetical protein
MQEVQVRRILVIVSLLVASVAGSAHARPYFEAHAGWSSYSMSDVNAEIGAVNATIAPFHMNEINDGIMYGAGFGAELSSGASIGIAYDRLTGSTDVGDATGSLEYDVPGNVFRATGHYAFKGGGSARAHVGASLGIVSEDGTISITAGGGSAQGDIKGSGALFEVFGGGDFKLGPQVSAVADVGYRHAKAGGIEVEGTPVYNAQGDKYSVDFSGFMLRAGLKVFLSK